jgi:hypothetical protein
VTRASRRASKRSKNIVYKEVDYRDDTLSFDRYQVEVPDGKALLRPATRQHPT